MSDFDPFDDELGAALRRRAGTGPASTGAAHDAVLQRAGTIRRRRAAIGGGGAMAVLLIGGIALFPSGADEVGPADTGDVLPTFEEVTDESVSPTTVDLSVPAPVTSPSTEPSPSITDAPTTIALDEGPSTTAPTTTAATTGPTTTDPTTTAPATTNTATAPATTAPATTTDTTEPTTPTLAPFTETYGSAGGSITVSWSGSALTLQSVSPASGFVAEVEQSTTTRVRVRFESDNGDSRIEVRVEGGQVSVVES